MACARACIEPEQPDSGDEWLCVPCKVTYSDLQRYRSHMANKHGCKDVAHDLARGSSQCPVCLREYFAQGRLALHFKGVPRCRDLAVKHVLPFLCESLDLEEEKHSKFKFGPKHRPVEQAAGPLPFWADRFDVDADPQA